MQKNSALLFLLPMALLAAMWATSSAGHKKQHAHAQDAVADADEARADILAERHESRRFFVLLKESILEELGQGELTLRLASDKLIQLARQYHVQYLTNVARTEECATALESMARNCLRQLRTAAEEGTSFAPNFPDLEKQLATIIAELEANSAPAVSAAR